MRYLRSGAAFAVFVLITCGVSAAKSQNIILQPGITTKLPFILKEALEKGDMFELYSLDPNPQKEKPENAFRGWKVLGKTPLKGDTRKMLLDALVKGVAENKGVAEPTFHPRHGIRVVYEGKNYDVVIDFDSLHGQYFIGDVKERTGGFLVTKAPAAAFDKVLKDAKVQLAEAPKTEEEKKEPVRLPDEPLPGFPQIMYNGTVLQVPGRDDKPLLKIVKAEYDKDKKMIVWLVELQADVDYESWINIHHAWQNDEGDLSHGPAAFFFDKDRVQLFVREMKEQGQLRNGKKGDRIRLILDASEGFPEATYMEIRRPLPASAGYGR